MNPQKLMVHIGVINHDGSGTLITSIDFVECGLKKGCYLCDQGIDVIPIEIGEYVRSAKENR